MDGIQFLDFVNNDVYLSNFVRYEIVFLASELMVWDNCVLSKYCYTSENSNEVIQKVNYYYYLLTAIGIMAGGSVTKIGRTYKVLNEASA
jgi:hypothetical protein